MCDSLGYTKRNIISLRSGDAGGELGGGGGGRDGARYRQTYNLIIAMTTANPYHVNISGAIPVLSIAMMCDSGLENDGIASHVSNTIIISSN